jgi:hypothetical protein
LGIQGFSMTAQSSMAARIQYAFALTANRSDKILCGWPGTVREALNHRAAA